MVGVLDYSLERTVAPTIEPMLPAAAKLQCGIELAEAYFDPWLEAKDGNVGAIQAAREMVEANAQVALMNQTWVLKLDGWPTGEPVIDLHIHPVQSITSVTYLDETGASQPWSSANYQLIRSKFRSLLFKPDADVEFPTITTTIRRPITITFLAGYPDPTTDTTDAMKRAKVPRAATMAMSLLLGHWFRNRESVLVGSSSKEIELSYRDLLNTIRPVRYV